MKNFIDYLNSNKVGTFASIENGKPTLRPFKFVFEKENKFYFVTANNKSVYTQLKECGTAGFCVFGNDMTWARLNGEVEFVYHKDIKTEVLNSDEMIKKVYKSIDNPVFEVFFIHKGNASLHNAGGSIVEAFEI